MDDNRLQQSGLQASSPTPNTPPGAGPLAYQNAPAAPAVPAAAPTSAPRPAAKTKFDQYTTPSVKTIPESKRAELEKLSRPRLNRIRLILTILVIILVLAMVIPVTYMVIDAIRAGQSKQSSQDKKGGEYVVTSIPLSDLVKAGDISISDSRQVNINGQLRVNNSLIIAPSQEPVNPVQGQLYLNQQTNQLYYYNGTQFVDVVTGAQIAQLNAAITANSAQTITVGAGLQRVGNELINTGVLALPQALDVVSSPTFGGLNLSSALAVGNGGTGSATAAGARVNLGAAASGANTDITSLGALTAVSPTAGVTYNFNSDPAGTYQFCTTAGNCSVVNGITGTGTAGRLAKFSGSQVVADSLLSETGTTATVNGDLAVTGNISGNGANITSLSASNISTGTLSDSRLSSNVALLNRNNQTFTGTNHVLRNSSNTGNAFQVQDASGSNVFNVDTITHDITTDYGNLYINALGTVSPTLSSSGSGGTLTAATYYYRVSAYSAGSQLSGAIDTTPSSATTTGSTSRNMISWSAVSGAAGYYIYRSTDGGATYRRIDVGNVTSAIDNGTTYTWTGADYSGDKWFNYTGNIYLEHGAGVNFNSGNAQIAEDLRGELEIANYNTGGLSGGVAVYSDYFGVYDTTDYHTNLYMDRDGKTTFSNRVDSTAGFLVQDAAGGNLLVVDTLNQQLAVGPSAVPGNSVLTVGGDTTSSAGGITLGTDTNLYRSAANTVKTDGNLQATGSAAFGSTATILNTGAQRATVNIDESYADTTGVSTVNGLNSTVTVNSPSANNTGFLGLDSVVLLDGDSNYTGSAIGSYSYVQKTGAGTASWLNGAEHDVYNYSTGTVANGVGVFGYLNQASDAGTITNGNGVWGQSEISGAGSIQNASGLIGAVYNYGTGTITSGYGLLVKPATNSGGGSFANNYGVYINDQSAVGSTSSYNLYSAGANAKNYLAGKLQVGSSNTASRVNIGTDTDTTSAGGITFGTDTNLYRGAANQLKTDDTVQIKTASDSTTAFQVQNASGTALLTADTSGMTITVQALTVTANLTVNGHLITGGSTPSAAVNANAGVGASCTVSGTDTAGTITVTTGSSGVVAGTQCAITFATNFGSAPRVVLGASSAGAGPLDPYVASSATNTFSIGVGTAGATGTAYKFDYVAAQ
ncbi:hypothetical protein EPO04_03630 [Patescibacteria group bacterium]|nr:MAG: hypothetical protein EPO04_03630 [Patescibacteria group bacterium]